MLELHPTDYFLISKWLVDFQKKSANIELPPDNSECIGIYSDNKLCGYFIILGYLNNSVDIVQGYLTKEARHRGLPKEAMALLESGAKKNGFKTVRLGTSNRFKSYTQFMKGLGYRPERIIFSKEI